MNNVNFGTKLIIEGDLEKSLKHSPINEIKVKTKSFVENSKISRLLNEDEVILKKIKPSKLDGLIIKINTKEIKIQRKIVNPITVIREIILVIFDKNNIKLKNGSLKEILNTLLKLLEQS